MKIAYGNSRMEKKWKNRDISWDDFCKKVSSPAVTTETVEEYKKMGKKQQDDIKDVGGFVGGHLKEGRRKSGTVLCRSMLTLDMDYGTAGVVDELEMLFGYQMCIYSTHKHTPEEPRFRLIIPMSREVSEEEYPAVGRMVAKEIGIDMFDDTTYQPQRLMYWPSVSMNGEFVFKELEGNILNPDDYLAMYDDWRDISTHPTSSRQSFAIKKDAKTQADPLEKAGIVGAFCRTYGIRDAIDKFLKDVYEPSAMEGRYDYIPADSSAGVTIHDEKFSYSFHATDPACGMLLNAFDVVRVHLFPDDDEKKSFDAMAEFARNDEQVKLTLFAERQQKAAADFDEEDPDAWKKQLTYQKKTGELENTLHNLVLIMENDEFMKNIVFNQLADGMEIKEPIPWNHPSKFWRDADDAQLICYVDEKYGSFSQRNYSIAVAKVVDDRTYHPIREFFQSLPKWDGVIRVETLLVDYLGADDSPYVRAITRKLLCAAYVRVHNPGAKFDNMIVLNGGQGIGKSTLINKLGGEWYSDSLNISDMNDKTAAEKLQGYWIMEIGELAGMRKADLDKVKAFISRQDDKYRASFGRRVTPHPRQCVFFGTTNSESGYLRDITGNRRYWNVKCSGKSEKKPWEIDREMVLQIWAEVMQLVKDGESLYLPPELEIYAKEEQRAAMEQDDREGLVLEYLEMLLPESWDSMDIYKRKEYVRDFDDPTRAVGVKKRMEVSNMEISDEAHHLNVTTKKLSKDEEESKHSWEQTVKNIFERNNENVLLEFTATCDLANPQIRAEYENKIIFDYPLHKFRADLYSKEIKTLRSDMDIMDRAIQALVLSQYRLKVFQDNHLSIKPVVLFKSAQIADSKAFMASFIDAIKNLKGATLERISTLIDNPTMHQAYNYFAIKGISFDMLAQELCEDFSEEHCVSVNDDKEVDAKQLLLNSLEDTSNPYRAIFEVKKLDEGWDVLNLFDIVRLYETRQSGGKSISPATVSEAQLIGRGARYCPFQINSEQPKFQRKYDTDVENELRICEELYYHCQNDSRYI